ncbi:PepSY domain-containing protein [Rhizobium sp. CC-YZS058]|uniref:PepSY domain-containing protein n=1 Tax=Rhizobium sp. CC-YZS058 TaxID=3042153 RepID=UPI002B0567A4|nr:PepSY domain-containing protein [Rhizobium sp. CC-YZS058]MEA3535992.1 PepSY domain-containing protein [Rhizobium sp. CC-YZS058]
MPFLLAALLAALAALSPPVLSAPALAAEGSCTAAPRERWMSREAIERRAGEAGYREIDMVAVEGSCYALHGRTVDHLNAEILMNPMTGDVMHAETYR